MKNNNIKVLILFVFVMMIVCFLFEKAYSKAKSAEDVARNTQMQMSQINNKLDTITDYFKITPKQEIINSIRINKVYPIENVEFVGMDEQSKVVIEEEIINIKMEEEKKIVTTSVDDGRVDDNIDYININKEAIENGSKTLLVRA